ncbi:hypothetical protein AWC05_23920 [Mycobacterium florentinum]|uniref:Secreted protein n=1 Tax=Mycobacterium florentinum TaxID=292462 RepID=A0A1X1U6S7_MYCFL|nr:hypothetical protein [Mycobacterium florentinum]MCV7409807.1 hypothetical protein [Mycobacterium florentinum]ORV52534.1 hypothetical protein AWC05_23920 [Mycobacterium florentinum]BBX79107.1 hypothetical protein MFLOJ_28940 [Mycobacterium florentinum]
MRIRAIAACTLALGALGVPTAVADPTGTLPPMTATNGGPIIGGGGAASQMTQQLKGLNDPNVQEVDGPDAAQFIAAAAGISDRDLASPFMALQRALGCQKNNAGFGARAYRRNDGKWGGAMLVIAKSAYPDVAGMKACEMSNWRRPSMGSPTSMCNSGWAYPPPTFNDKGGDYIVLLAGTNSDFCTALNGNYKGTAAAWP